MASTGGWTLLIPGTYPQIRLIAWAVASYAARRRSR